MENVEVCYNIWGHKRFLVWFLFTLGTPLRLLSVKWWKKTHKSKFCVIGGQIACCRKIPLSVLCHGFNSDILGQYFLLWSSMLYLLFLLFFKYFFKCAVYQLSDCILDSGFTFITWQHAFSVCLVKHCSRLWRKVAHAESMLRCKSGHIQKAAGFILLEFSIDF